MPVIGPGCHELRLQERNGTWRVFYRIDPDAIVVAGVIQKKTQTTPQEVIGACKRRLGAYDRCGQEE
jgi:phage-related protein